MFQERTDGERPIQRCALEEGQEGKWLPDSPRIGADTQLQTNEEAFGEGARCLCVLLFHGLRLLDHRIIDRTEPCFSGRRLNVD